MTRDFYLQPPLLQLIKMPPQRTPLGSITGNRGHRPETTPYERGLIAGAHIVGLTERVICEQFLVSRQRVRGSIVLEILNTNGASLPRPGRPILYDPRDQRHILRSLRMYPKWTFQQHRDAMGTNMSNTTIKRITKA